MKKTGRQLAVFLIAGLLLSLGLAACSDSSPTPAPTPTVKYDGGVSNLQKVGQNLTTSVDALNKNDLAGAKTAYQGFTSHWNDVEVFIRSWSSESYEDIQKSIVATGHDLLSTDSPDAHTVLADLNALQLKYKAAVGMVQHSVATNTSPDADAINGPDVEAATTKISDYLNGQVAKLVTDTQTFSAAVKSHDIAKSKAAYEAARFDYEGVEFLAEAFSETDVTIDARPEDFAQGEKDPDWTGFHPLEKALYVDATLNSRTDQLADKLSKDVASLRDQISTIEITPTKALSGALDLIEEIQSSKITGEEERYSHTDLNDFRANLSSAKIVYDNYAPFVKQRDAALDTTVTNNFNDVQASIAGYFDANNVAQDYSKVDDATRKVLAQKVEALADNFSKVPGTLGLRAQG